VGELLPQREDLQILGLIGAANEGQEIEDEGEQVGQGAVEHEPSSEHVQLSDKA
jgi:hypothetical protein